MIRKPYFSPVVRLPLLGALSLMLLAGCAGTQVTPISLGDGRQGHVVDCSRFDQSMSDCLAAANEQCDGNYEILATTGQWTQSPGPAMVLEKMDRAMLIRCEDE